MSTSPLPPLLRPSWNSHPPARPKALPSIPRPSYRHPIHRICSNGDFTRLPVHNLRPLVHPLAWLRPPQTFSFPAHSPSSGLAKRKITKPECACNANITSPRATSRALSTSPPAQTTPPTPVAVDVSLPKSMPSPSVITETPGELDTDVCPSIGKTRTRVRGLSVVRLKRWSRTLWQRQET